jgi:hypothetical protein
MCVRRVSLLTDSVDWKRPVLSHTLLILNRIKDSHTTHMKPQMVSNRICMMRGDLISRTGPGTSQHDRTEFQ